MLLHLECGKLKGLGEPMRVLDSLEGEAHFGTKRGGSAHLPIFLRRMLV